MQGTELEKWVLAEFREVFAYLKMTAGSGNKMDDADLRGRDVIIEAKGSDERAHGYVASAHLMKIVKKVEDQAKRLQKEWMLVVDTSEGDPLVVLRAGLLRDILKHDWPAKKAESIVGAKQVRSVAKQRKSKSEGSGGGKRKCLKQKIPSRPFRRKE